MGISSKKSSVKQSGTSTANTSATSQQATTGTQAGATTSTLNRTNPAWVTEAAQGLTGKLTETLGGDPTRFVAGPSTIQQSVFDNIGSLGQRSGATLSGAADTARGLVGARARDVSAESLLSGLDDYFNPYDERVRGVALDDYDIDAGKQRAALSASGALNGAFGGSRFGLREAETAGELARGRGALDAGLLHTGFATAADLSDRDAARRQGAQVSNQAADLAGMGYDLSAAGLLNSIGANQGADERANLTTTLGVGGVQQGLEQALAGAPLSVLQGIAPLFGATGRELFSGTEGAGTATGTTSGTSTGSTQGTTTTTEEMVRRLKEDPSLWEQLGMGLEFGQKVAAMF